MQLAETSIRRPVFATVLSLLIVLIGAVSFNRLSVREYPKIDEPVVSVQTRFGGASSEVIESQVTKVLEDSLAGIEGVDVITSISRQERSLISIRFALSRDPDSAAADVRDKVSRVRQRLPQGIDEPVIAKVEAESFPVVFLALSSDTHTPLQLTDMANQLVKPVLQTAPGAADVNIYGERKLAMRIGLDPDRLAAYRITVQDVEDALRRSNLEVPAGRIESRQREFNVTAATDLQRPAEFRQVVIRTVNGLPVRIADVARVQTGAADERSSVRLNGRDVGGGRRDPPGDRQSARTVGRRAPLADQDRERPAGRRADRDRQRQLGLHRPFGQGGLYDDCRGRGAGRAGHLRVPAHHCAPRSFRC